MKIAKFQNAAAAATAVRRSGLQGDISANPIQIKLSKNAHREAHMKWADHGVGARAAAGYVRGTGVAVCLHKNMQM